MPTCKGLTKGGASCMRPAGDDGYCSHHSEYLSQPRSPLESSPPAPSEAPEETEGNEAAQTHPEKAPPQTADKYELARRRREKAKARNRKLGALPGQRLVAPSKRGFHRRWVNDEADHIDRMQDKGYTFVEDSDSSIPSDDPGDRKSQVVGVQKNGEPLRAYLMETPEEFFQEDKQAQEARIRETETQVRRAQVGGSQGIGSDPNLHRPASVKENQLLED